MDNQRDSKDSQSKTPDRFAIPVKVRITIAESRHRIAETRYHISVLRAQSLADKLEALPTRKPLDSA